MCHSATQLNHGTIQLEPVAEVIRKSLVITTIKEDLETVTLMFLKIASKNVTVVIIRNDLKSTCFMFVASKKQTCAEEFET